MPTLKYEPTVSTNNEPVHIVFWLLLSSAITGTGLYFFLVECDNGWFLLLAWFFCLLGTCPVSFGYMEDGVEPTEIPPGCPTPACGYRDLQKGKRPRPESVVHKERVGNSTLEFTIAGALVLAKIATGGLVPIVPVSLPTAADFAVWECSTCSHCQVGGHEDRYPESHELASGAGCGCGLVLGVGIFAIPISVLFF